MSFSIDPSQASIDLDCMTVEGFSIDDPDAGSAQARPMTLEIELSGGLGKIRFEGLGSKFFDDDIQVIANGLFPEMSDAQKTELNTLMERWRSLSIPLRFMVFAEKAVLLEDSDEFLVLPPGERKVTVGNDT
jgi:hypothetical protein